MNPYADNNFTNRSLFHSMNISAQGLSVQRTKMNVVAENLANVDTTRTANGEPYRRKLVQVAQGGAGERFIDVLEKNTLQLTETNDRHSQGKVSIAREEQPRYGVKVNSIVEDQSAFRIIHDPAHPDADREGYVRMPNINHVQEMIELITATRSYEANVTALNSAKEMVRSALRI
jgi:flagellar basal-body rod protein FlgC